MVLELTRLQRTQSKFQKPEMSKHKEPIASFKDLMGANIALLRCMGLFFMDCVFTGKPKRPGAPEAVFISAGVVLVSLMVVFAFRTALLVWEQDLILALNLTPIAISATLCVFKGLRLLEKSRDITYLLNKLGALWGTFVERRRNEAEVSRMIRVVTGHRNLYVLVIMGGFLLFVMPAHMYILGQVFITKDEYNSFNYSLTVFPLVYPFPRSNALCYSLCVLLEHLAILFIAFFWCSCDSVFAQVTTHVAIHFESLPCHREHIQPDNIVDDANDCY
ncbi:uncharacterized protein LOC105696295 [Orussus abietinus]|uniref:uncharacterized protein LOC105696295 n=1 Tax=Orussus abietinus TaxID=222816 RepID=UPI000C715AFC|nr:uncharacterized protein LOC105696295 [Orussus abietinus]